MKKRKRCLRALCEEHSSHSCTMLKSAKWGQQCDHLWAEPASGESSPVVSSSAHPHRADVTASEGMHFPWATLSSADLKEQALFLLKLGPWSFSLWGCTAPTVSSPWGGHPGSNTLPGPMSSPEVFQPKSSLLTIYGALCGCIQGCPRGIPLMWDFLQLNKPYAQTFIFLIM